MKTKTTWAPQIVCDATMIFKPLQHIFSNRFILVWFFSFCFGFMRSSMCCSRSECAPHEVYTMCAYGHHITDYAKRILSKCNRLLCTHRLLLSILFSIFFFRHEYLTHLTHTRIVNGDYLDTRLTAMHFNLLYCRGDGDNNDDDDICSNQIDSIRDNWCSTRACQIPIFMNSMK